jgi:hypothetical protein
MRPATMAYSITSPPASSFARSARDRITRDISLSPFKGSDKPRRPPKSGIFQHHFGQNVSWLNNRRTSKQKPEDAWVFRC